MTFTHFVDFSPLNSINPKTLKNDRKNDNTNLFNLYIQGHKKINNFYNLANLQDELNTQMSFLFSIDSQTFYPFDIESNKSNSQHIFTYFQYDKLFLKYEQTMIQLRSFYQLALSVGNCILEKQAGFKETCSHYNSIFYLFIHRMYSYCYIRSYDLKFLELALHYGFDVLDAYFFIKYSLDLEEFEQNYLKQFYNFSLKHLDLQHLSAAWVAQAAQVVVSPAADLPPDSFLIEAYQNQKLVD